MFVHSYEISKNFKLIFGYIFICFVYYAKQKQKNGRE